MEAYVAFGWLGVIAAFVSGLTLARSGMSRLRAKPRLDSSKSEGILSNRLAWLVRNGVKWTMPVARAALHANVLASLMDEAVWIARLRGMTASNDSLLSAGMAVLGVVGVVIGLLTRSIVCGVAVVSCLVAIVVVRLRASQDRRREDLREAIPDALRSMGVCFQTGLSLMQTFRHVASEAQEPLRSLFEHSAHRMEAGQGAQDALDALRRASTVPELGFVAVALDVQHQAGGSVKQVLDAARDTVEGEIGLKRSLRVQTAQAKLSARVVSVMPFALIAIFSLVSEGFLAPFFESALGLALLGLALGMQAVGIVLVRRMLAVEVD